MTPAQAYAKFQRALLAQAVTRKRPGVSVADVAAARLAAKSAGAEFSASLDPNVKVSA